MIRIESHVYILHAEQGQPSRRTRVDRDSRVLISVNGNCFVNCLYFCNDYS